MSDFLRFGVLGAARITPKALIEPVRKRSGVDIVAIGASSREKASEYAKLHGINRIVEGYDALVCDQGIDAVYCPLPPVMHVDLVTAALEAGKHVLCEKPFAMNAQEAQRMAAAAISNNRILMEAFHYRYHPAFEFVLSLIRSGRIGRIAKIDGEFAVYIPDTGSELRHVKALGGGALMDLGCYPLHMARTIAGAEPTRADSTIVWTAKGVDEKTTAILHFPNKIEARVHCEMGEGTTPHAEITCLGDKGEIVFMSPVAPHQGHHIVVKTADGETFHEIPGDTTYDYQLEAFINALSSGAALLTGPDDAIATMSAIDLIYASARE